MREALAAVLERTGGDAELARELAALFLEDAPALLASIRRTIAERDGGALKRHAHRLKGAVAVFDAGMVFQTAARLESLGEQGHVEAAAPDVEVLAAALLQLQTVLVHLTSAPVMRSSVRDAALKTLGV